ncbi:MAG: peptide-methionine (S)-S-oxide reductase MsrA [Oligoflexus sp.]
MKNQKLTSEHLASFGGGCFWCMEPPFDHLRGIMSVLPGYMGGHIEDPTYEQVCSGRSGHIEVVQIRYDPDILAYQTLLDTFWKNINPTQVNQQFADVGSQYQTVIFYHSPEQKELAEASKRQVQESKKFAAEIATLIRPAGHFYPAESYHCKYYQKNPAHYQRYKIGSGRAEYLQRVWQNQDEKKGS